MSAMMPERPTLAGDWQDDDGQVFDALVEPQADPLPVPAQVLTEPETKRPARTTRILSGTAVVDPAWSPMQVLPEDPNREHLVIQNNSTTATDGIRVADDGGKLQSAQGGGVVFPANPLTLWGHTGAVMVSAAGAAAPVPVSWWAVTK